MCFFLERCSLANPITTSRPMGQTESKTSTTTRTTTTVPKQAACLAKSSPDSSEWHVYIPAIQRMATLSRTENKWLYDIRTDVPQCSQPYLMVCTTDTIYFVTHSHPKLLQCIPAKPRSVDSVCYASHRFDVELERIVQVQNSIVVQMKDKESSCTRTKSILIQCLWNRALPRSFHDHQAEFDAYLSGHKMFLLIPMDTFEFEICTIHAWSEANDWPAWLMYTHPRVGTRVSTFQSFVDPKRVDLPRLPVTDDLAKSPQLAVGHGVVVWSTASQIHRYLISPIGPSTNLISPIGPSTNLISRPSTQTKLNPTSAVESAVESCAYTTLFESSPSGITQLIVLHPTLYCLIDHNSVHLLRWDQKGCRCIHSNATFASNPVLNVQPIDHADDEKQGSVHLLLACQDSSIYHLAYTNVFGQSCTSSIELLAYKGRDPLVADD